LLPSIDSDDHVTVAGDPVTVPPDDVDVTLKPAGTEATIVLPSTLVDLGFLTLNVQVPCSPVERLEVSESTVTESDRIVMGSESMDTPLTIACILAPELAEQPGFALKVLVKLPFAPIVRLDQVIVLAPVSTEPPS
jgi:hypothetical protein